MNPNFADVAHKYILSKITKIMLEQSVVSYSTRPPPKLPTDCGRTLWRIFEYILVAFVQLVTRTLIFVLMKLSFA